MAGARHASACATILRLRALLCYVACATFVRSLVYFNFLKEVRLGGVEIRNFTRLRQKILWYNSRIPALAINLQVDDDLFNLVLSFSVCLIS